MRRTGQSVKCKVSLLLAKLLLTADISEIPSIGWGCMHEEDAVMECKCPYAVRGMFILEVWNKAEYLEMHEGKLEFKRGHRYYTQITGDMTMSGLERLFFVVWAGKGDPFVGLIHFEAELWQQVLPNLSAKGNFWV